MREKSFLSPDSYHKETIVLSGITMYMFWPPSLFLSLLCRESNYINEMIC